MSRFSLHTKRDIWLHYVLPLNSRHFLDPLHWYLTY